MQRRVVAVSRRGRAMSSSNVDVVDLGDVLRSGDTDNVRRSFFFLYPSSLLAQVHSGWPQSGGGVMGEL